MTREYANTSDFDRCWACAKRGTLVWIGGFAYGEKCGCGRSEAQRASDERMTNRQIFRRVHQLYQ